MVEYREGIQTRFPRIVPASVGLLGLGISGVFFTYSAYSAESPWPLRVSGLIALVGLLGLMVTFDERHKRVILTGEHLTVGKDCLPLSELAGPVIEGEEAAELASSIAFDPLSTNENKQMRLLGGSHRTTPGQQPVLVRPKPSEKLLVIGSWRPEEFATALEGSLEGAKPGQWSD